MGTFVKSPLTPSAFRGRISFEALPRPLTAAGTGLRLCPVHLMPNAISDENSPFYHARPDKDTLSLFTSASNDSLPGYDTPQVAESMSAGEDEPPECDLWAFVTLSSQCEKVNWPVGRSLRHPESLESDYTELSYDRDICTAARGIRWVHLVETEEKASKEIASGEDREGKEGETGSRASGQITGGEG